jgi:hypothetical protein
LQGDGHRRNAGALHPKHHGQGFVREQELVRLHVVLRHQQQAATSLLYGMKVIAYGGPRDLIEESTGITKHYNAH